MRNQQQLRSRSRSRILLIAATLYWAGLAVDPIVHVLDLEMAPQAETRTPVPVAGTGAGDPEPPTSGDGAICLLCQITTPHAGLGPVATPALVVSEVSSFVPLSVPTLRRDRLFPPTRGPPPDSIA
jgi:hypothetical protein